MMKPKSIKIFNEEPNVNFYAWQIIIQGFFRSKTLKKYIPSPLAQTAHILEDHGKSGIELESWNKLGEQTMKHLKAQEWSLKEILDLHYKPGKKIFALYQTISKKNLILVGNSEYLKWFKVLWNEFLELNGIGMVPVVSDYEHEALSTELREILKSHNVVSLKINTYVNTLTAPTLPLSTWQERLELLQLAQKHKTLPKILNSKDFKHHLEKYEWLNYGYQGPAMLERDFVAMLEKIFSAKVSLKQQFLEHKNYFLNLKKQQEKIITRLKLSPKEKYLFETARIFAFAKGYRVDIRHAFHFISDKMFIALGQRFSLPMKWFHYAQRPEIEKLLRAKKLNITIALKRSRELLWVIQPHKEFFVPVNKIPNFYKKYVREDKIMNTNLLAGQPAFLGKVRGKVKIVHSAKDLEKVRHGDVLVAITTNPDLLPAMYRAIAFVTDSGGITSHAAIVAREMKKPCIIGTKFATKILKDGDLVEVDANKGIIRKIK